MTTNNTFLGDNELVIVFRNGTHHVIEKYEDWDVVFTGHYEQCISYCDERWIEYQKSLF